MKRAIILFTLLTMLVLVDTPAHAQFWKKIFRKEEKKPVRPANRPAPRTTPSGNKPAAPQPSKSGSASKRKNEKPSLLAPTVTKDRYRIDVLAPVYLNELVVGSKPVYKSHLPDKVLPGLGFYQGIKLAADTLNAYGYHLDVHFHDIMDPAHSIETLIRNGSLDSSDLIIGSVPANKVTALAAHAKMRRINFVSALSPADGNITGNPYFNLLQPSLEKHCDVLRSAIARKSRSSNILVYHRSTVGVDEQCFRAVTRDSAYTYMQVVMNSVMPAEKLRNFLDSNAENVIVMPIVDVKYATQLLEQLGKSFPKHRFEVYGMPSWRGISLLRKEGALSNVGITFSAPFYFDPSASAGRGFSETYTREFGGKPSEMAFRGYETLYWYAYLLKRYGSVFNDHYGDNGPAPFTRFDMRLSVNSEGEPEFFENNHAYLYRYQGGSFSVEQ